MNKEELEKMLSDLESDLWNLKHNIAYINGEKYHGISRDLLGYIRDLEQENKELHNKIDKAIEIIESYNLGKYDYSIPPIGIIDLLEILKDSDADE